jgi:predicted hydrolase (HD superfamily)
MNEKLPLSMEQAENFLAEKVTSESQQMHAKAVRAVMAHFAERAGEDVEYWSQVGLLHDIDYELYPENHLEYAEVMLSDAGYGPDFIHAVLTHGWGLCKVEARPELYMEKVLYATDELTGLITATVYMRPDRSIHTTELKSVKKKFKNKKFAAGVDREVVKTGAEMLEMELDELITETILAMRKAADELGLAGTPDFD